MSIAGHAAARYTPPMFVRIKTTPNSPRRSVQLVEGVRDRGKVRQRIVRHIGVAMDEDELERLRQLGEYVKAKLEQERQPLLFAPEKIAEQVIRVGRQGDGKPELPVDLKQLEEEQRLVTGVHEVYGEMYRLLGLDALLPRSRYRASHDALFHVVMARVANPDSKRGSVRRLEEDFGVSLPLEKVYRMMDQLDAQAIDHLRTRVGEASRALLPEPAAVLFFDCTTLAFETAVEDELRQHGFSKDGKHGDSQVLLALMVTREGLPISYEVFPGATYEGRSLAPVLQDMQRRHQVERTVCVADRGMLSAENLDAMDKMGNEYVVGARLRNLPSALKEQVLDLDAFGPLEGSQSRRVGEWEHKGRRLIVVFCPKRARKDAHDRRKAVERLLGMLERSDNPKEPLSNHGAKRFIAVEGDARLTVNPEKIAAAERWDGFAGVITNLHDAAVTEVLSRYQGLWQVEESFRITKHDLRVRPVWHWTPDRIRAHIAISFMAFACVRHLAYRVAIQKHRMSPEVIRSALVHRQCSILRCRHSGNRYVVPSKPTPAAEQIYATMGLPLTTTPYQLA